MQTIVYEIMHMDKCAAKIDSSGQCIVMDPIFMPYNLYFEEETDIDTRINNITNFYYWCSTRMLTLDRQYAKEILNSIGARQAVSDKERAQIALLYRCASLIDVFWVKEEGEDIVFSDINLYENHLSNAFIDISLRGRQYTADNKELARDLSTNGCFPKAWRRMEDGFELLKDGGEEAVKRELLASQICRCFRVNQIIYEAGVYDGEPVSVSKNITSKEYSLVSMEALEVYAANHRQNVRELVLELDPYQYHMMNIVDYLVGNTDRHWGNWGVLVENHTNQPVRLHDLMDFNRAFYAYDSLEGANCLTSFGQKWNQKEAALHAVKEIGLNQTAEIPQEIFAGMLQYYDMFLERLELLRAAEQAKRLG